RRAGAAPTAVAPASTVPHGYADPIDEQPRPDEHDEERPDDQNGARPAEVEHATSYGHPARMSRRRDAAYTRRGVCSVTAGSHYACWSPQPERRTGEISSGSLAGAHGGTARSAWGGVMRLLLFFHLHLDGPFGWAEAGHARARRRAQRECLRRICNLAESADALCCGGDLYEQERVTPDTAACLRGAFGLIHPRPVYLAPGNHDWFGPRSLYRQGRFTDQGDIFAEPRVCAAPGGG